MTAPLCGYLPESFTTELETTPAVRSVGGVRHGRVAGAGVSFSECAIRLRSFRVRSLPGKGFLVPAVEHRIFDVELVGQVTGEMGGQMRTGALSG